MEPLGLAVGLVALITPSIECFQYIRLSRAFGRDYSQAQLRIDLFRLRLSRWERSLLEANKSLADATKSLDVNKDPLHMIASPKQIELSRTCLGHIRDLLERATKISKKFTEERPEGEDENRPSFAETDNEDDLERTCKAMHRAVTITADRLQKKTGFLKKARWAILGRANLDNLLKELDGYLTELERAIPSLDPTILKVCTAQVEEIQKHDNNACDGLKLLRDINDQNNTDYCFATVVAKEILSQESRGHHYNGTSISEHGTLHQGDTFESGFSMPKSINVGYRHAYSDTTIQGFAQVTQGNIYRGMR